MLQPLLQNRVLFSKAINMVANCKEIYKHTDMIMKNSIKTLAAILVAFMVSSLPVLAATPTTKTITNVTRLEVSGRVQVHVIHSANERVEMYDPSKVSVRLEGNVLKLSSLSDENVSVVIGVKNLSSIIASGMAKVSSVGKLNLLDLTIKLSDFATADINTSAVFLSTKVGDYGMLKLTGNAVQYSSTLSASARVTLEQFSAESTNLVSSVPTLAQVARTGATPNR